MPVAPKLKIHIGVDPGQTGGLVSIAGRAVIATPMPKTERDIWEWFRDVAEEGRAVAVIERVHSFPGSGPRCLLCKKPQRQQGVASTFKFGTGYGGLRMALTGNDIRSEDVTPRDWQKGLGLRGKKKGESRTQWKNYLKGKAQQLFPHVEVTLATADALLIAEFCRRKNQGLL